MTHQLLLLSCASTLVYLCESHQQGSHGASGHNWTAPRGAMSLQLAVNITEVQTTRPAGTTELPIPGTLFRLSEVKICSIRRSAAWIRTFFRNIS